MTAYLNRFSMEYLGFREPVPGLTVEFKTHTQSIHIVLMTPRLSHQWSRSVVESWLLWLYAVCSDVGRGGLDSKSKPRPPEMTIIFNITSTFVNRQLFSLCCVSTEQYDDSHQSEASIFLKGQQKSH